MKATITPLHVPTERTRGRIFIFHPPDCCQPGEDAAAAPQCSNSTCQAWVQKDFKPPQEFQHCAIYNIICQSEWCEDQRGTTEIRYPVDRNCREMEEHFHKTRLEQRAPIVFIVHGLAGYYLKKLIDLLWGTEGKIRSCTPQLDRLRGVLFLGRPGFFTVGFYPRVLMRADPPTYLDEEPVWEKYLEELVRHFLPNVENNGYFLPSDENNDYPRFFLPNVENNDYILPIVEINDDRIKRLAHEDWRAKLEYVNQRFERLKIMHGVKTDVLPNEPSSATPPEYETGAENSPAHLETVASELTAHTKLREVRKSNAVQRFWDTCKRVERLFELETLGRGYTSLLSHDLDWNAVHVSLERKRPFDNSSICAIYHPGNYNPSSVDVYGDRNTYNGCYFLGDLPVRPSTSGRRISDFWLHLPANNEAWMEDAMLKASPEMRLGTGVKASLGHSLKARQNFPHSRYILPNFEIHDQQYEQTFDHIKLASVCIAIPYLHWDTLERAQAYSSHVWHAHSPSDSPPPSRAIPRIAKLLKLMQTNKNVTSSYHPRRTLDQFAYSRVKDTRERDKDQTITRLTKTDDVPNAAKMIMIDQLWLYLWIVESQYQRYPAVAPGIVKRFQSGVVTCFPDTTYARSNNEDPDTYSAANIRERVLEKLETTPNPGGEGDPRTPELASTILSTALRETLSIRNDWSLDILELFQEAIGEVSDKHIRFFRAFEKSLKRTENDSQSENPASMGSASEQKRADTRREQVALGLEIADILDELNMLKQLFEVQNGVLRKGGQDMQEKRISLLYPLQEETKCLLRTINNEYLPKVLRMIEDVHRLQRSVLDLLDLQQKEASIDEAKYANQQALFAGKQAIAAQAQADATEAQSQILFIFTVITVVFLPLSFITSYYGMNIVATSDNEGNSEAKNYSISDVRSVIWKSLGGLFGLFIVVGVWYWLGRVHAAYKTTRNLVRMRDEGYVPPKLIDKADSEFVRMKNFDPNARLEVWWCPHCWFRAAFSAAHREPEVPPSTDVAYSDGSRSAGTFQGSGGVPKLGSIPTAAATPTADSVPIAGAPTPDTRATLFQRGKSRRSECAV